ncbi:Protein MIZU-KUSSEI 1, partial [Cucurbita argyrosperma subsp. sororia]
MAKIDALRRFFLPCFFPPTATTATAATAAPKKRLSTSLRDDLEISASTTANGGPTHDQDSPATTPDSITPKFAAAAAAAAAIVAPPRPSKTMVIGTIFGHRRGHVWFCVQQDRLRNKPFLLLELPILTHQLVNEMRFGLVRIALECNRMESIVLSSIQDGTGSPLSDSSTTMEASSWKVWALGEMGEGRDI